MDDGVDIATTMYVPLPGGCPHRIVPLPAVMLFHGLGGNRQTLVPIADRFAKAGYVVLTFDFRGHGESGGLFTGLGPRELTDIAQLRERFLPTLAPVDESKVGAWGISLGGGAALRSVGEGEPYAAVEVVETWTDLYEALVPQGLPKSGAIFQFLSSIPSSRQAPELLAIRDAVAQRDVRTLRAFAEARSSRHLLARGYPPTLFFQGRRDFAFGLEQGISAFRGLREPRALYIGPFGHAPSKFPGPDLEIVSARALAWFDRWLRGMPNGVEDLPSVELAPDPFHGKTVGYRGLPPTRTLRVVLGGRATIGSAGKAVRRVRVRRLTETFGAPIVRVSASSTSGWSHLVAVLTARTRSGSEIVVSEGGVPTSLGRRARTVTIRLISQVTTIPAGSTLELTLAGTSTAQNAQNLLYLVPVPERARVTLGKIELRMPVLKTAVSR